jgi:hypothetical protein
MSSLRCSRPVSGDVPSAPGDQIALRLLSLMATPAGVRFAGARMLRQASSLEASSSSPIRRSSDGSATAIPAPPDGGRRPEEHADDILDLLGGCTAGCEAARPFRDDGGTAWR